MGHVSYLQLRQLWWRWNGILRKHILWKGRSQITSAVKIASEFLFGVLGALCMAFLVHRPSTEIEFPWTRAMLKTTNRGHQTKANELDKCRGFGLLWHSMGFVIQCEYLALNLSQVLERGFVRASGIGF